jgi:Tfp pilus assembly major pilin PilA
MPLTTTSTSTTTATSTSITTTTITTTTTINTASLFSTNRTGSQLNEVLTNYTGDLSACLANCSNQGICILNSLQQYICECNQYRTGKSCQSDTRPCSSNPCLNNGLCIDTNNQTLSFQCICSNSSLFYGTYC